MTTTPEELLSKPTNLVPGPTNTAPNSLLHLAVLESMERDSTQSEIDARRNWNARVEIEQAASRKRADRWDVPLKVQVAPKLFDKLGPQLTEIWKKEVPFEEETSRMLKAKNAETQAKLNAEEEARLAKAAIAKAPISGSFLVRYENGKEVECLKIEPLPIKPSFWSKVKTFFWDLIDSIEKSLRKGQL